MHLQVALGGEGLLADVALEGLVSGVGSHVNLQSGARAEVAPADVAEVLVVHRRIETGAGWPGGHQGLLEVQRTSWEAMSICECDRRQLSGNVGRAGTGDIRLTQLHLHQRLLRIAGRLLLIAGGRGSRYTTVAATLVDRQLVGVGLLFNGCRRWRHGLRWRRLLRLLRLLGK